MSFHTRTSTVFEKNKKNFGHSTATNDIKRSTNLKHKTPREKHNFFYDVPPTTTHSRLWVSIATELCWGARLSEWMHVVIVSMPVELWRCQFCSCGRWVAPFVARLPQFSIHAWHSHTRTYKSLAVHGIGFQYIIYIFYRNADIACRLSSSALFFVCVWKKFKVACVRMRVWSVERCTDRCDFAAHAHQTKCPLLVHIIFSFGSWRCFISVIRRIRYTRIPVCVHVQLVCINRYRCCSFGVR